MDLFSQRVALSLHAPASVQFPAGIQVPVLGHISWLTTVPDHGSDTKVATVGWMYINRGTSPRSEQVCGKGGRSNGRHRKAAKTETNHRHLASEQAAPGRQTRYRTEWSGGVTASSHHGRAQNEQHCNKQLAKP